MSRVTKLHPRIVTNSCHLYLVSGEILYIEISNRTHCTVITSESREEN